MTDTRVAALRVALGVNTQPAKILCESEQPQCFLGPDDDDDDDDDYLLFIL